MNSVREKAESYARRVWTLKTDHMQKLIMLAFEAGYERAKLDCRHKSEQSEARAELMAAIEKIVRKPTDSDTYNVLSATLEYLNAEKLDL